ncbi:MAG TPA: PQQ-dependent sugar dehydrogenase [Vicinamibacterales bacterium]|nr:PQQ-dependent sugar dehydrogenase [Vicinamibacterales bacterium]
MRAWLFATVFVIAQSAQPQCGTSTPAVNGPVTDTFTTSDGLLLGVQVIATNLEIPWSLAFAPDGRLFFTERPGRVRIYLNGQVLAVPALTLDDVHAEGESGALGIALHPDFANNHFVYILYTANTSGGVVNRLARYREANNTLADRAILFEQFSAASIHDGGRIKFGPDGKLYITMGDAANTSNPQSFGSFNGKILRVNDDASTPADNPFGGPIWTLGHRNPQGIAWHPATGDLWGTEHGNVGNDEVNLLRKGRNYGWPVIEGAATRPDMEAPVRFYSPSIAPSGAAFYNGALMPGLRNNFIFATLAGRHIERLVLDQAGTQIASREVWLQDAYGRIRDIVAGPDGALYFCTNNRDGRGTPTAADDRIARIVPRQ